MNKTPSFEEVWQHLAQNEHVEVPESPSQDSPSAKSVPWYVAGLMGISGWIAAIFLASFLLALGIIDNNWRMLLVGAVITIVALGIKLQFRNKIFPSQLALALSLAGQGLVIGSQFENLDISLIVATVLILEGLLFIVYPDALHRLISFLAIVVACVVQINEWSMNAYLPLLVVLLSGATLAVWLWQIPILLGRLRQYFAPLSIGLPVAALGLCIVQLIELDWVVGPWWQAAVGLALMLLVVGYLIFVDLKLPFVSIHGMGVLLLIGILMVPSYETPGVMAASLVMGIAFWRRYMLLLGIGIAGMLLFVGVYYYHLELTLLIKSYILMASGAGLLLLYSVWRKIAL